MDTLRVVFSGVISLPWWGYVAAVLITTHITIASVTIYLHRYSAHRALELHPIVEHLFRFWLWLTTGMITKVWTAIHREHHAECETKKDPHSPQILGLKKVLLEGAELYRVAAKNDWMIERRGGGTPNDWIEQNVYSKHEKLGIGTLLVAEVLLFGPIGATMWAVQMAWIPFFAAGVINGLGHWAGKSKFWCYRNFDVTNILRPDRSSNVIPWGVLIGGEELHNNHHKYPRSAKLSCKKNEFDIGWVYIRALQKFGLARVKNIHGVKQ